MIYYKLTCIKDMPGVEKGFSHSFKEEYLSLRSGGVSWSDNRKLDKKINILLSNRNEKEFVKIEPDFDRAIKELKCPRCNKESLFVCIGDEKSRYDADVTVYSEDVMLKCPVCRWCKKITSIVTGTKVDW